MMHSNRWLWAVVGLAAFLFLCSPARSADDELAGLWAAMRSLKPKTYVCYRATPPPQIDGKLTDSCWDAASWTAPFVDIEGPSRPAPRFRTRAKMSWDREFFYFGALLEEPHVWATLTDHDSVIFHDNDFEVFIDPDGDNHEYYEFEMNALNTTWDLFLSKPYMDRGKADNGWEIPGLKTAVAVRGSLNDPTDTDRSWSLEIAIPWTALAEFAHRACPPHDGDQWRVNFSRVEWRHNVIDGKYTKVPNTREDNWVWSPQGIINMHRPERWGYVQFSNQTAGPVSFNDSGESPARERLMELYHRQRGYQHKHKRWAKTIEQLQMKPDPKLPIILQSTSDGYEASLLIGNKRLTVRQDSRLTVEAQ